MTRYRVAVDIGGTFTDIVAIDNHTGVVNTGKVPSTPLLTGWGVSCQT
jgi:N-methylhydantoinase A/oxoprolinase/acetone carboxylase beta subunit